MMVMFTQAQGLAIVDNIKMRKRNTYTHVSIVDRDWLTRQFAGVAFNSYDYGVRFTRNDRPGHDVVVFNRDGEEVFRGSGGLD